MAGREPGSRSVDVDVYGSIGIMHPNAPRTARRTGAAASRCGEGRAARVWPPRSAWRGALLSAWMALPVAGFACSSVLGDVDVDTEPLRGMGGASGGGASGGGASGNRAGAAGAGAVETITGGIPAAAGSTGVEGFCDVGAVRCEGAALQLCAPDGARWITTAICASPTLCSAAPPRCIPPACALDQLSCDGATLQVCNANRDGWTLLEECASPAHCVPKSRECLAAPCSAGELACNQSQLQRCADDELGWVELATCESQPLCEAALASGVSACAPPSCEVGEQRCSESDLEVCNEGRTGFDLVARCENPVLCELSLGTEGDDGTTTSSGCTPPVCESGQVICQDDVLATCNVDRTGFELQQACGSAALCDALGDSCRVAACERGEHRCNGANLEVCNQDLTGFDLEQQCASAALCREGNDAGCAVPACSPGQSECRTRRILRVCNADLTGFDEFQCGARGCDDNDDPPDCNRSIFDLF